MGSFEQGDVVVPFPYTDRSTRQWRPALVVSKGGLGEDRRLRVVMITSAENRPWAEDVPFGRPTPKPVCPRRQSSAHPNWRPSKAATRKRSAGWTQNSWSKSSRFSAAPCLGHSAARRGGLVSDPDLQGCTFKGTCAWTGTTFASSSPSRAAANSSPPPSGSLDHATVSRRIAALEATVGAKLFDRRTTGAKLTSAGERFIGAAEEMESAFLHAQGEISGVDLELTGDVRIGAPDGFSTYYLTHALRDFAERHPGVRLQLMPLPQLTPLARREVDIVVGLDKPEAGRFVARKLTDYTLGIYASAAYLKQNGAPARRRGPEAAPTDRLRRGARVLHRARLCARALRRRADDVRMRQRRHPA